MEDLTRALHAHPFCRGLDESRVRFIVGCAKNVRFAPGEYLFREGQDEHALFLVRSGSVAIEADEVATTATILETLEPGDVVGVSWLTGHPAHLDCRAREPVLCFRLDGDCLKRKMDEDPALGYAVTSRLLESTYERLRRARLQKLDLYR